MQIGHSVTIGDDTVIAAQVGIAGSTKIGRRVTLAGQVGMVGHIEIGDGVIVTAQSGIPGSLEAGAVASGSPAIENRAWLKSIAVVREAARAAAAAARARAQARVAARQPLNAGRYRFEAWRGGVGSWGPW